jgi:hypothetical protein
LAVFIAFFFVKRQAFSPGAAPPHFLFLAAESGERGGELAMIQKKLQLCRSRLSKNVIPAQAGIQVLHA